MGIDNLNVLQKVAMILEQGLGKREEYLRMGRLATESILTCISAWTC